MKTEASAQAEAGGGASPFSHAPLWATLTATFFGTGLLRPGPGTWASAATILLWWLLSRWIVPASQTTVAILLALAAVAQADEEVLGEAADLLYHAMLLLQVKNLSLAQVAAELELRHRSRSK